MTHALALHPSNSRRDPAGTRHRILTAAIEEFRCGGLAGARVDSIARRAQTNERMLYYYFGNKEQLFVAVVEDVYQKFADAQAGMDLSHESPELAMRRFVRFIWEYCYLHPEVVRVINNENLQEGVHLRSSGARNAMRPVIAALSHLLERGIADGAFRQHVDPLHFYLAISGLGYYLVSNRFTLHAAFARDPAEPSEREHLLTLHLDMLLAYLRCDDASVPSHGRDLVDALGRVGAPERAADCLSSGRVADARSALHDTRRNRGIDAGTGADPLRQPVPSFFPGIVRAADAETERGNDPVSDAALRQSGDGLAEEGAPDGAAARVETACGDGTTRDHNVGAEPAERLRGTVALTSVAGASTTAGLPPKTASGVGGTGERPAVFWPKSRFPSL